ncbi:sel1 repeat family protein, partial [Neisseria sp. P0015.S002]
LAGCLIENHDNAQYLAIAFEYFKHAARAGHTYARYNIIHLEENNGIELEKLNAANKEHAQ